MIFHVNYKSGKPIYLQVVDQVKAAAASGAIEPGEALPSIRPLAEELRVNRNTIAKAYSELESLDLVETRPGRGCFLKENHAALRKQARLKLVAEDLDQVIVQAHNLRVGPEELLRLVAERLDALDRERRSNEGRKENERR